MVCSAQNNGALIVKEQNLMQKTNWNIGHYILICISTSYRNQWCGRNMSYWFPYGNGPKLARHFIIDSGDLSVLSNDARNLIGCRDLWVQRSEGKRKVLLLSTKIGLRWNMVTQRLGLMIFVRRGLWKLIHVIMHFVIIDSSCTVDS